MRRLVAIAALLFAPAAASAAAIGGTISPTSGVGQLSGSGTINGPGTTVGITLQSSSTGGASASITLQTKAAGGNTNTNIVINNDNTQVEDATDSLVLLEVNGGAVAKIDGLGVFYSTMFVGFNGNFPVKLEGTVSDGATAVGVAIGNSSTLANAAAAIVGFYPNAFTVPVLGVLADGTIASGAQLPSGSGVAVKVKGSAPNSGVGNPTAFVVDNTVDLTLSNTRIMTVGSGGAIYLTVAKATMTFTGNLVVSGANTKGTISLSTGTGTATVLSGAGCVCTDTTANASVQCNVSGTTLTATGTGSDVIRFICL